ncbi:MULTISPECIES: ABC transporter ATP-binding protein [unclassified Haematospirillum]|uniref:ABC transporter ATP-binding protein n=1 Tax=unclassified Haematospirillum TaxID=2622088 RepID=UPI00143A07BE|nr:MULTISPECIES: ATP-binding cassette domain-containing protein [unclassified Haematospirillum]NKD55037.1 ATP-binding cassette domain-containing protein [Haematospirillum sp. H4890]NKD76067.1 ATP-binding cassette domain-containing protein [Haematospirillum sp. H4485]
MSTCVLDIQSLEGSRGGFRFLLPAMSLSSGQAMIVTGPSGCGKSTLLDILGLILQPGSAGTFQVRGIDIPALWASRRKDALARVRAERLGYILQTGGLLPFVDVLANIRLSARAVFDPAWEDYLVDVLGLRPLISLMPSALSIGERQRVAVARALLYKPDLVLADEPTAALDPARSADVMALLLELVKASGSALVLVSHDQSLVGSMELPILVALPAQDVSGPRTLFAWKGASP